MLCATLVCAALAAAPLDSALTAVASLPGEPSLVSAAGLVDDRPVLTIENRSAFERDASALRVVVVGTDDASADAAVAAVRWLKTSAPQAIRERWVASALPLAQFAASDKQSLARWMTFQVPDLVVEIGPGGAVQLADVRVERIPAADAVPALEKLLASGGSRSALHTEITARVGRSPLDIARLLAGRYPETPSISYIPAVSWVNTLRLAAATGDASLRDRVMGHVRPWLADGRPLFGDRIQLTSVAGTMVFADLSADPAARSLAEEGARRAAEEKSPGVAQYGGGWTDDMFMATVVLARTGKWDGRAGDFDTAARLLTAYAGRLQRADGLFNHAIDGPAAWGRGNGFAAMGLTEALTAMPLGHPQRDAILAIYRRQMTAVAAQQAPDGMWREVIDEPGAYREETATAMLLTAMARGVRLGWIDRSYQANVDRAWRGLAAHVRGDGTIVDVCASTGGGPTRKYYLERPAITGADDRGGAMALLAAMEMRSER